MTEHRDPKAREEAQLWKEFLLEDFRLWLRELEKQDRWFAQNVWVVLTACALGLYVVQAKDGTGGASATALIALAGSLFISMNADFLANRVVSYRQVSRRVAAVRRSLGYANWLGLPPNIRYPGSPMLSANPAAFVRTAYLRRGVGFRHLFLMNTTALAALYLGTAIVLRQQLSNAENFRSLFWIFGDLGILHWIAFRWVFRWRVSEATTLGEFIVTVARDKQIGVADDGEERLHAWIRRGADDQILRFATRVIPVIVAYEDKRFWRHPGVDPLSLVSVFARRRPGGATTIAMQLARQLMPAPHVASGWRRVKRKLFEAVLGTYLVFRHGRRFVLSTWLRVIPFGRSSIGGLTKAANSYLGKS